MKTTLLVALSCVITVTPAVAQGETTRKQFEEYVKERLPQIPADQRSEIARLVDENGGGKVDDAEFAKRMQVVSRVTASAAGAGGDRAGRAAEATAEAGAARGTDYMDGDPVVIAPPAPGAATTLLLITGDDLAAAWLPFARWKTSQGWATRIVSMRQIARTYEADSIQEKIRLCVRDHIDNQLTRYWLHGLEDGMTTGQAVMAAKHDLIADAKKSAAYHLCMCELNLLGDPTLRFRAVGPRKPTFEVPDQLGTGEQSVRVKTNAPGATVCLWKGAEVYAVAIADRNGEASVSIAPTSPGDLIVTIAGAGLNTVQTRLPIGR